MKTTIGTTFKVKEVRENNIKVHKQEYPSIKDNLRQSIPQHSAKQKATSFRQVSALSLAESLTQSQIVIPLDTTTFMSRSSADQRALAKEHFVAHARPVLEAIVSEVVLNPQDPSKYPSYIASVAEKYADAAHTSKLGLPKLPSIDKTNQKIDSFSPRKNELTSPAASARNRKICVILSDPKDVSVELSMVPMDAPPVFLLLSHPNDGLELSSACRKLVDEFGLQTVDLDRILAQKDLRNSELEEKLKRSLSNGDPIPNECIMSAFHTGWTNIKKKSRNGSVLLVSGTLLSLANIKFLLGAGIFMCRTLCLPKSQAGKMTSSFPKEFSTRCEEQRPAVVAHLTEIAKLAMVPSDLQESSLHSIIRSQLMPLAPIIGVIGPPGSGQTTLCKNIARLLPAIHINVRQELEAEQEYKRANAMDSGHRNGNGIAEETDMVHFFKRTVASAWAARPTQAIEGCIILLDGYPETVEDEEILKKALGREMNALIALRCDAVVCRKRLLDADILERRSSAYLEGRFESYRHAVSQLLSRQSEMVFEVDGSGSMESTVSGFLKLCLEHTSFILVYGTHGSNHKELVEMLKDEFGFASVSVTGVLEEAKSKPGADGDTLRLCDLLQVPVPPAVIVNLLIAAVAPTSFHRKKDLIILEDIPPSIELLRTFAASLSLHALLFLECEAALAEKRLFLAGSALLRYSDNMEVEIEKAIVESRDLFVVSQELGVPAHRIDTGCTLKSAYQKVHQTIYPCPHIVAVVGVPSCGKTAMCQSVAKSLNIPLLDARGLRKEEIKRTICAMANWSGRIIVEGLTLDSFEQGSLRTQWGDIEMLVGISIAPKKLASLNGTSLLAAKQTVLDFEKKAEEKLSSMKSEDQLKARWLNIDGVNVEDVLCRYVLSNSANVPTAFMFSGHPEDVDFVTGIIGKKFEMDVIDLAPIAKISEDLRLTAIGQLIRNARNPEGPFLVKNCEHMLHVLRKACRLHTVFSFVTEREAWTSKQVESFGVDPYDASVMHGAYEKRIESVRRAASGFARTVDIAVSSNVRGMFEKILTCLKPSGKVIAFIGPPGSGVSTQARRASTKHSSRLVSAPHELRWIGRQVSTYDINDIYPAEIDNHFVRELIGNSLVARSMIVAGMPESEAQLRQMKDLLGRIDVLIYLNCPAETCSKRLLDAKESISGYDQLLLANYHDDISKGALRAAQELDVKVVEVNASGSSEQVAQEVDKAIAGLFQQLSVEEENAVRKIQTQYRGHRVRRNARNTQ